MNSRRKSRHWLWLILGILAAGIYSGRSVAPYHPDLGDPLLEPWRWSTFPELSGLAAKCVTEGKDGTMWFGTLSGVWSYDGFKWVHYSLDQLGYGGDVVALCPAADGGLYLGTAHGIGEYHAGTWTRLFPPSGHRFGEIRKLAVGRDGSLWAATAWGALRFHNAKWFLYTGPEIANRLSTNQVGAALTVEQLPSAVMMKGHTNSLSSKRFNFSEVCADQQGRIWLGTEGGEVLCCEADASGHSTNVASAGRASEWTLYNELDGIVRGRDPSILPLQNGSIWVLYGANSSYLNVFDGVRWRATPLSDYGVSGNCSNPIQTHDGVIWLSGKYVIYACRNGHWRSYEKPEVPIPSAQNFLFQSADGALWIFGPGTEIQRVDYQTSRWLTLRDLIFQWESPSGTQWFLHRSGRVVVHKKDGQWMSYGTEDGVIDAPVALVGARNGDVWVAGSEHHVAAMARFDGHKWTRYIQDQFSWGVDWRGVLAASDGSVWFSAAVDTHGPKRHKDGLLQFRDGKWIHYHQPGRAFDTGSDTNPATLLPATQYPEPIGKFLCLGESADGRIWAGRNILIFGDGIRWRKFSFNDDFHLGMIETMFTTRDRELWIGSQQFGALCYDGRKWRQFQGKDSLEANTVRSFAQSADGSIWAATDRGFSRFDGHTWTSDLLPAQLNIPEDGGSLKASPSGALWINHFAPAWMHRAWLKWPSVETTNCEFWTVRRQFRGAPPKTTITTGTETVSQPGNVSVFWSGAAPWREQKDSRLQFSYRLDDEPWSPFTFELGHAFFTLPAGRHHLEVRARDQDFIVDPHPATLDFVVLPPVWRQAWFIVLMILLTGLILAQSVRVLLERSRLRTANVVLAGEVKERKRAETEVRLSEELYRSFIAASPDGVAVIDAHGGVQFASSRIYEFLGIDPKQAVAPLNALEKLAPEDRERAGADMAAVAKGKVISGVQYTFVRQDGSRLPVEISGAPLVGADNEPAQIVTIVRDATLRQQAEAAVRKLTEDLEQRVRERTADLERASDELKNNQQKLINTVEDLNEKTEALSAANSKLEAVNKEMEAFAYSVSHDLRAPLRGIDGFSQALFEDYNKKLDDEGRHFLQRIRSGAQRMAQLIDDMLELSRVTRGELRREKVNLSNLAQEIAGELAHREPGRKVVTRIVPDLFVVGDAHLLRLALENLLGNAWKFTSKRPEASIEFGSTTVDGRSACFVRDNGAGFDMNYAGRLFGAFQRLHTTEEFPGSGIGLATVQRIIHRHGGRIWAESKTGEGATFYFTLL